MNKAIPREIWRGLLMVSVFVLAACGSPSVSGPGATPTSAQGSQSAAASSSPPPVGVADALRYFWVRETRDVPGLFPPAVESIMKLDETEFQYLASQDWDAPVLVSTASASRPDRVTLRLNEDSVGCSVGAEGTYTFKLSETGRALTVRGSDDSCAALEAAISGNWTRAACPDSHVWCLGELDAGRHESVNYTPFVRFPDWQFKYGRFAYRVPRRMGERRGQPGWLRSLPGRPGPEAAGIFVFSDVLPRTQEIDPDTGHCPIAPAHGVRASASAIRDWLRALPSLKVSHGEEVRIGGLVGYSLDVSMNPAWKGSCGWSGDEAGVSLFLNAQSTAEEGLDWGIAPDGRMRLFLVDLGPDRTLLIDIEAQDRATWEALLAEAVPVVFSFEFRR